VQHRGQQGPVCRSEVDPPLAELTFQYSDLMPQGEDIHVFILVAHRQQPQRGEHAQDRQVAHSQQHEPPSCRPVGPPTRAPHPRSGDQHQGSLTRPDEVSARTAEILILRHQLAVLQCR